MSDPLGFIHRFIPGSGPSAPVLLLLHGTGGSENDLLDLGHGLLPGASLLSPRGKILEQGMPRFFRRLAEGVFDEEDLIMRTHELAEFVEAAALEYQFQGRKVIAVGYSNGANIAASLLLLRPEILGGAVLLRAMVPLVPAKLPDLARLPIFLAAGRHDSMIPPPGTERLAALLRQAGADVALQWSAAGHQLTSPEIADAQRWLETHFAS
ncbi:MAG: phospholipase/carboxylesterase [Chthoniobacter sp.]|jgi:predicted esterase|nr:phospholipase/carboxylesterase [Chthoniobacter sp.]